MGKKLIVGVALLASACATGGTMYVPAPGETQTAPFEQAKARCQNQAHAQGAGMDIGAIVVFLPEIVKTCMRAQGYVQAGAQ